MTRYTDQNITQREQLLYTASLEYTDESVIFTGFHWPIVAARVAQKLHAPNLTSVFEAGIFHRGVSNVLPTSTTEVNAFEDNVDAYGNTLDTLHTIVKSDRLDGAVIDVSNVDRFGNVNSSVIGAFDEPQVRLPGPGGAKDIATHVTDLTLITGTTDPERYQDKVTYISSPGHLDGDGSREVAGFDPGTGPSKLITPLGTFRFDDTGRAQLETMAPGAGIEQIREMTGWSIPDAAYETQPTPDSDELTVIRDILSEAAERNYRLIRP